MNGMKNGTIYLILFDIFDLKSKSKIYIYNLLKKLKNSIIIYFHLMFKDNEPYRKWNKNRHLPATWRFAQSRWLGAEVCGELYRESRITRMSVAKKGVTGATHCVVDFSPDSQAIDGRMWQDSRTQTWPGSSLRQCCALYNALVLFSPK